jgi:hypothetical protein
MSPLPGESPQSTVTPYSWLNAMMLFTTRAFLVVAEPSPPSTNPERLDTIVLFAITTRSLLGYS